VIIIINYCELWNVLIINCHTAAVTVLLVLDRWAPSHQGNSLSCHCCHTALYKDATTSV